MSKLLAGVFTELEIDWTRSESCYRHDHRHPLDLVFPISGEGLWSELFKQIIISNHKTLKTLKLFPMSEYMNHDYHFSPLYWIKGVAMCTQLEEYLRFQHPKNFSFVF